MRKTIAGGAMALVLAAACALAGSPAMAEDMGGASAPEAAEEHLMGEPIVGYGLEDVDARAEDAGYRIVSGVPAGVVRKYVKVSDGWTLEYVVLTDSFVLRSATDLTVEGPGAVMGYPVSVSGDTVCSTRDFVDEWFSPVPPDSVPPMPDGPVPAPMPGRPAAAAGMR